MFRVHKGISTIIISAVASTSFFLNNQFAAVEDNKVPIKSARNNKRNKIVQFYNNRATTPIAFDQPSLQSSLLHHLIHSVHRVSEAEAEADDNEVKIPEQLKLSEPEEKLDSSKKDGEESASSAVSEDESDEKVWKEKAENCGFCKYFLTSPCAEPFKAWSLCVDKAKAENSDFVSRCAERTAALMECTSSNSEYFNPPGSSEDSESESDGAEDEAYEEESSSDNSSDASETENIEQDSVLKRE
jgi:hypothetical protein